MNTFLQRLRTLLLPDPARDWLLLIICAAITLACIIVWNAFAFDTVANGGTIGAPATSTPPIFSQASLDTVHTIFTDRAIEEGKYTKGIYRFADPSK